MSKDQRLMPLLAFLLLSLVWGSSYLFIRIGLEQLSPPAVVAMRLTVGAIGILTFVAIRHHDLHLPPRRRAAAVLIATTNTSIPFLLISWGEQSVPSGLTAVLNSTTPIFSVLIAGVVLHDEPLMPAKLVGVVIGFGGVVVLLSRDLARSGIHWSGMAGQGAIVLAALCYAASAVVARKTLRGEPSMTVATWIICTAGTETLILSLLVSPPPLVAWRPSTVFAVLWLGLLGTAFAYILYYFIIENWGASRTTLVTYAIPVVGLPLGAIVLSETIDWRILAGSVLVIGGIVLAGLAGRRPAEEDTHRADGRKGSRNLDPSGKPLR